MSEISYKGVNLITEVDVSAAQVEAKYHKRAVVNFKTQSIGNCSTVNNELVVELTDEIQTGKEDILVEIRLCVHQPQNEEIMDTLANRIKQYAGCEDSNGAQICILPDLPFSVPRGKYTADLFAKNFKLHGSSYNYTIAYKNITRAFLLPMPDKINVCFVIGLDKPIRQGQTDYKNVVISFKVDQEIEVELRARSEIIAKIDEGLSSQMMGRYYDVFTTLFKGLSGVNVIRPSEFRTTKDESGIKCSVGARQGHLFILQKGLIFILKPIIYIKFEEITKVQLHRVTSNLISRAFDMEVILSTGQTHQFSGIDKAESEGLMSVMSNNGILVTTAQEENIGIQEEYEDEDHEPDEEVVEDSESEYGDGDFIAKDPNAMEEEEADEDYKPKAMKKKAKAKIERAR
jgi:structure-specific recognition protein 1